MVECLADAKHGTGTGLCGRPVDIRTGLCDRPSNHIRELP